MTATKTILLIATLLGAQAGEGQVDAGLRRRAMELAREIMIVDTHQDTPYRLKKKMEDISRHTAGGHFDYPRAKQGGLDGVFMAAYIPPSLEAKGQARAFANDTIDMIERLAQDHPEQFVLARSVADIQTQFGKGPLSVAIGIENGAPLEGNLANLRHFYDRGVRYITLCHSKNNHICDSSFDTTRRWHGLSPFGKQLIPAMNRLGMMIDVSHISDDAFYQVIELSQTPVVATHSSCRHFTPGWERNMSDDMIRLLAKKGGLIHINFGSIFVSTEINRRFVDSMKHVNTHVASHQLTGAERDAFAREYFDEHPLGQADIADVVAHIDHVVQLVGIDHVGIGSDFDGVGNLPRGLADVSCYPSLIQELLRRDYSEDDIRKICATNFLHVWSTIQEAAN